MKVLITGGAGYIGRTVVSALAEAGYTPVILDSFVVGPPAVTEGHVFYHGDIADGAMLNRVFQEHPDLGAVMHFAARIDVEESTRLPSLYYRENLGKAQILLEAALEAGIRRFLFSSTAAVYEAGHPSQGLREDSPTVPLSAYAASKLMFERVMADICLEHGAYGVALRYFNPVGADPRMRSGPFRRDPSHLLGKLTKLATAGQGKFTIYGNDYDTRDGTPMRDFIHVWDLAGAHLAALEFMTKQTGAGFEIINVGSGTGVTVKEFVQAFLEVSGTPLNVVVGARRAGDSAGAFADTTKAQSLLGWTPSLSLKTGIADALTWEKIWNGQSKERL